MIDSRRMHPWWRTRSRISLALAALIIPMIVSEAGARPLYKGVWEEVYAEIVKGNKVDCSVCHSGKDKSQRNTYAAAFEKELGEKNCHDREKIAAAIRAIEKKKCRCGVWIERIKEGKRPCMGCGKPGESVIERLLQEPDLHDSETTTSKTGS